MTKRLTAALLLSCAMGIALALPTKAETPPGAAAADSTSTAGAESKPSADEARQASRAADRKAFFEAQIAALHAGLTLSPDQDKLWPAVEQAIRGYARMRLDLRDRRMDLEQDRDDQGPDAGGVEEGPIEALSQYSTALLERAQALKALSDAAEPLYATLSDDQKRRLPRLLRDIAPRSGPGARLAERFEGQANDRDEGPGPEGPRRPSGHAWEDEREGRDHGWRDGRMGDRDGPRAGLSDDEDDDDGRAVRHRPSPRDDGYPGDRW